MRRVGIKAKEILPADLRRSRAFLQPQAFVDLPLVPVEQLAENLVSLLRFGQNPCGGHLTDIGRRQIDLVAKTVAEPGQLDPFRVQCLDDLVQFLLGSHQHPCRRHGLVPPHPVPALLAQLLHHRPEVLDPLDALGHVSPDLIDDIGDRLSLLPPGRQLEGLLDQVARRDLDFTAETLCPAVGFRVGVGVHSMEDGTGLVDLVGHLPTHRPAPLFLLQLYPELPAIGFEPFSGLLLEQCDELLQPTVGLEALLQLRNVEIVRIIEAPEQRLVHVQRDGRTLPAADRPVHLHVEHHDLRRNPRRDAVDVVGALGIFQLPLHQFRCRIPEHRRVRQDVAQVLGEGRFTRAEEARQPDPDPLLRVRRPLGDGFQQRPVVLPDRRRGHILRDLGMDHRLVPLGDLDDLLDGPPQIPCDDLPNFRDHVLTPLQWPARGRWPASGPPRTGRAPFPASTASQSGTSRTSHRKARPT